MSRPSICHPLERDRGHGLCNRCYQRDYRLKNRARFLEVSRDKHFIRKFGITAAVRDAILASQGHACALCREALRERGPRTHTDHDHNTGRIRGVLCNRCNWYMEKVDADPAIITRIVEYRGPHVAN